MNLPITSRVKGKKSCGCNAGCSCSKSPNKMADLSGDGKVTFKDVLIGRGVIDKKGSPNKMGCYGKKK